METETGTVDAIGGKFCSVLFILQLYFQMSVPANCYPLFLNW